MNDGAPKGRQQNGTAVAGHLTPAELTLPPAGKSGWPWTGATPEVPVAAADGRMWPRVTVVTPSFNQGEFLEETIRSVLLQGYPNLEYIVMDGGSTDGSVDIIKRYEQRLAHWETGPDGGQSAAINRGWNLATGEFLAYLNSDDLYLPGAILRSVRFLTENPAVDLVYASAWFQDDETGRRWSNPLTSCEVSLVSMVQFCGMDQPSVFLRRSYLEKVGQLREDLHFSMDYDYWLRGFRAGAVVGRLDQFTSVFRVHPIAKSSSGANNFLTDEMDIFASLIASEDAWSARLPLWWEGLQRRAILVAGAGSPFATEERYKALDVLRSADYRLSVGQIANVLRRHDSDCYHALPVAHGGAITAEQRDGCADSWKSVGVLEKAGVVSPLRAWWLSRYLQAESHIYSVALEMRKLPATAVAGRLLRAFLLWPPAIFRPRVVKRMLTTALIKSPPNRVGPDAFKDLASRPNAS